MGAKSTFLEGMGKRIRKRRISLGMSQDVLAQLTGYTSRSSIAKIEKGGVDLTQTKIVEIAEALKTTPAYVLGDDRNNNNTIEAPSEKLNVLFKAAQDLNDEQLDEVMKIVNYVKTNSK